MHGWGLRRWLVIAGAIAAVAAVVLIGGLAASHEESSGKDRDYAEESEAGEAGEEAEEEQSEEPLAVRRLEEIRRAVPGNVSQSAEGPGSWDIDEVEHLTYPGDSLPLASLNAARVSFEAAKGRPFPKGKGQKGTWTSIGPSIAEYQATPFRTFAGYVPTKYVAGGRTTALALDPDCRPGNCRMWIGPAGGGVWRTKNALDGQPSWEYLSGSYRINAIGSIALDPNDPTHNTIWVGTGEGSACASGCVHGEGLYKSTDGGDTWTGPIGADKFAGRGIGDIVFKPGDSNTIYVGSTWALHGYSSVCCSGIQRTGIPGAALYGLYKTTDGGATWSYIHNGAATVCNVSDVQLASNTTPCSTRGVRDVALDPSNSDIVYAASFARGVWRSNDAGATWTQIKPSLNAANVTTRPMISVTKLPNGKTRMYVAEGAQGAPTSRVFRSDDVATGAPVWQDLTSASVTDSRWGTFNFCTGQCWYDNFVYSPPGHPDMVYVGGSYQYGEIIANHRGVVLSRDAGQTWTDMTMDATDELHPNALHPDQHNIVTAPSNPLQFWEVNDGGVMRSSGELTDASGFCSDRPYADTTGSTAAQKRDRCRQMLSAVPTELQSVNKGLSTLQFQSLSVNPFDVNDVQGGTQDNGTWENFHNPTKWVETYWGDGGQSGFDVADRHFRFHTYTALQIDVNYNDGEIADWLWVGDPMLFSPEASEFYTPVISDPKVSRTLYGGMQHVWRTKKAGGDRAFLEAHCNTNNGDLAGTGANSGCGDWVRLGDPADAGALTNASYGDRAGGNVAAVERAKSDTSTMWAATSTGRVFVSRNADAEPATAVTFTRIDTLAGNDPNRFVSSIYIDPGNANHAWISYSGFSAATPATPGHVFEVTYSPAAGTATWTSLDGNLGELPITDLVRDDVTGDLYAGSDYGALRLAAGTATWTAAAPGMPYVEVPGLTIVPGERVLYAATHGLGAWRLNLG